MLSNTSLLETISSAECHPLTVSEGTEVAVLLAAGLLNAVFDAVPLGQTDAVRQRHRPLLAQLLSIQRRLTCMNGSSNQQFGAKT